MAVEDKIAAIRREIEERAREASRTWEEYDYLASPPGGVFIYGVPLNEEEVAALCSALATQHPEYERSQWLNDSLSVSLRNAVKGYRPIAVAAIWEMLERGKK